mmetsp:Transcript_18979/g.38160  ORF Transcript_18979/g.38160 Transcript_18979/m.38160 type:complete len:681 (+) Transcript_18979:93-2135(+)
MTDASSSNRVRRNCCIVTGLFGIFVAAINLGPPSSIVEASFSSRYGETVDTIFVHAEPIRFAVLGSGNISTASLAPILRSLQREFTCRAVWSIQVESASILANTLNSHTSHECDAYGGDDGLSQVLNRPDIDAVIISVPLELQPGYILRSLAAGKHVLSEGPIAATVGAGLATVQTYQDLYQPKGLVWKIPEESRYSHIYTETAAAVRTTIGIPEYLNLTMNVPKDSGDELQIRPEVPPSDNLDFFISSVIPQINGLRLAAEPSWPEEVAAIVFTSNALIAEIKFENDMRGYLNVTCGESRSYSLQVKGTEGVVELVRMGSKFRLVNGRGKVIRRTLSKGDKKAAFRAFARDCRASLLLSNRTETKAVRGSYDFVADQALADTAFFAACLESNKNKGASQKIPNRIQGGLVEDRNGSKPTKRSCSCMNSSPRCCERSILRDHKFGTFLLTKLFDRPQGISFSSIDESSFPDDRNADYRHVVLFRSLYESMVSGYLYHRSGRECWLDTNGVRFNDPEFRHPFEIMWEDYVHQPLDDTAMSMPPTNGRSFCTYLDEEKEEVGMRIYMDFALKSFYSGLASYLRTVDDQKQTRDYDRSMIVCYQELSQPDAQAVTFQHIVDWLYPGGHEFPMPPEMEHEYSGGHSTSKDSTVRERLYNIVKAYDVKLFNRTLESTNKLFGCAG